MLDVLDAVLALAEDEHVVDINGNNDELAALVPLVEDGMVGIAACVAKILKERPELLVPFPTGLLETVQGLSETPDR